MHAPFSHAADNPSGERGRPSAASDQERLPNEHALSSGDNTAILSQHAVTISIIDDDPGFVELLSLMVKSLGYGVRGVSGDALQGLEMVRQSKPDLVLVDIMLPGDMDGVTLCEQIQHDPGIPVVIVTGHSQGEVVDKVAQVKPHGLLFKPLVKSQLQVAIESSLRHHAQERLQLSQTHFKTIFEQAAVGMSHCDLEGFFLLVNQRLCRMLGYGARELLSLSWRDVTHPDDLPLAEERWRSLMGSELDNYRLDKRYLRKDGGTLWARLTVSLEYDASGAPAHVISVVEDISDFKTTLRELESSRALFKGILDAMPSAVIGLSSSRRVTHWNNGAESLTGRKAETAMGLPAVEAFPLLSALADKLDCALVQREVVRVEKMSIQHGDEARLMDIQFFPLTGPRVDGVVIRFDDVTKRVRMEEAIVQTEKMLGLGGLAAGIVHEINSPLCGILQSSQVALRRLTTRSPAAVKAAEALGCDLNTVQAFFRESGIETMLESVREQALRANAIIQSMQAVSRTGISSPVPEDIHALLDKSLDLCRADLEPGGETGSRALTVRRDYAPDLPPVFCSSTQMIQVFMNLLRNAAQSLARMPSGSPDPVLTLRTSREDRMLRVDVADNGSGMDQVTRRQIFEPFFTTKPQGEGTGLGLWVTYFIITRNHEGTIEVESQLGQGTTFTIRLPLRS